MLLGFKTAYLDQPTHFIGRILLGNEWVIADQTHPDAQLSLDYATGQGFTSKLHTLRHDPHGRWKPGRTIQFATVSASPILPNSAGVFAGP